MAGKLRFPAPMHRKGGSAGADLRQRCITSDPTPELTHLAAPPPGASIPAKSTPCAPPSPKVSPTHSPEEAVCAENGVQGGLRAFRLRRARLRSVGKDISEASRAGSQLHLVDGEHRSWVDGAILSDRGDWCPPAAPITLPRGRPPGGGTCAGTRPPKLYTRALRE